jgi:DnaJ family protein A protein 2
LIAFICVTFYLIFVWIGGRRRRQRGDDTIHPLKVSLEDLYNGKVSKLQLSRNILCKTCNGYVFRTELILNIS